MSGTGASSSTGDSLTGGVAAPGFDDFEMRLGDMMRGERATIGKSLLDVQRELRIRASYIAAIENCDISAFDAPSFISGYVRSYARYLGMDQDWVFRRFCAESGFQPIHGMAPAAAGPKPTRRPSDPAEALANPKALFIPQRESFWSSVEPGAVGSLLVLVALVFGLGYAGWSVLQQVQKVNLTPSDQAPAVIAALDPVQDVGAVDQGESGAADLPLPERMPAGFRLRAFEPGRDEQEWLRVNAAAFAGHPEQGRMTLDDLRQREAEAWFDPAGFLLAERAGSLLGFHWTKRHPDGAGEVYVLGVAPAAQGLGLGRALLVRGLRHLTGSGCPYVLLYVDGDNPGAVRLYERDGFARFDLDVQWRTA